MNTNGSQALRQLETRQYRASMKDHVTKLYEYGLAFLGKYCAVVGRSLQRERGGVWVITGTYDSIADEKRRKSLYASQTS